MKQAKEKLTTGHYAFPFVRFIFLERFATEQFSLFFAYKLLRQFPLYLDGFIDSIYRENGKKCGVTYAREAVSKFTSISMMLAKNGPYTKLISERYFKFIFVWIKYEFTKFSI